MPRLVVESRGMIKGGHLDYTIHSDGRIDYTARITAKKGMFSKTIEKSGTFHAEREAVLSSSYDDVGEKQQIKSVNCYVNLVQTGIVSQVAVTLPDVSGTVSVDISREIVDILRVEGQARVAGYDLTIVANKA